jgi:hypothetical protein
MRTLGGLVLGVAVAAAAMAIAAAPSHAQDSAQARHARSRAYDGLWSVSILTQTGPCDASYRYPARIVGGQITHADRDLSYEISGAVAGSGAIAVTVSKGIQSATGYGRLRGARGGGRWTAGAMCSGVWSATRRASN